uniref:Uncharacterized protein n=1 Tax=Ixodes ricinus TaxID=34613 RepID=A0A147BD61_IXORI
MYPSASVCCWAALLKRRAEPAPEPRRGVRRPKAHGQGAAEVSSGRGHLCCQPARVSKLPRTGGRTAAQGRWQRGAPVRRLLVDVPAVGAADVALDQRPLTLSLPALVADAARQATRHRPQGERPPAERPVCLDGAVPDEARPGVHPEERHGNAQRQALGQGVLHARRHGGTFGAGTSTLPCGPGQRCSARGVVGWRAQCRRCGTEPADGPAVAEAAHSDAGPRPPRRVCQGV